MYYRVAVILIALTLNLLVGCKKVDDEETNSLLIDASLCQFTQGECKQNINGVTISLLLNPTHTPSEKPIKANVSFSEAVSDVSMNLEGRDMFMGVIPVKLSQMEKNQYQGTVMFGACSSGYMVWQVTVDFDIVNFESESESDADGKHQKKTAKQQAVFYFLADAKA